MAWILYTTPHDLDGPVHPSPVDENSRPASLPKQNVCLARDASAAATNGTTSAVIDQTWVF